MLKQSTKKAWVLITAAVAALALTSCSVAQRVPDDYLTNNYLAVPASTSADPQVGESTRVLNQNRTYATPEKPKTGKPPKAVTAPVPDASCTVPGSSGAVPGASSVTSSGSTSSALTTTTYKRSETDEKQEVLGNVEIISPDVVLKNKYIKGTLVVKDSTYGSLTLQNCKIDGTVTIEGDLDTLDFIDTTMDSLYLYSGSKITVNLEGKSVIMGTYIKGTDVILNAYNIQMSYTGYNVVTIEQYTRFKTYLELHGADCKTVINNSESEVTLDNGANPAYLERFIANDTTTIFGAEQIEVLNANAKSILLHGTPKQIIYDDKRFPAPVVTP